MARKRSTRSDNLVLPEQGERASWARSIRLSGFTVAMLIVLVLMIVVLTPTLRTFVEQQQEIASLKAAVSRQKQDLNGLKDERARWDDPSYIEAQARERLNYVYPGEYSYLVIDDDGESTTSDGQPISDKVQTTQVDWIGVLFSSVLTAGLTQAKPNEIVAPVIGENNG